MSIPAASVILVVQRLLAPADWGLFPQVLHPRLRFQSMICEHFLRPVFSTFFQKGFSFASAKNRGRLGRKFPARDTPSWVFKAHGGWGLRVWGLGCECRLVAAGSPPRSQGQEYLLTRLSLTHWWGRIFLLDSLSSFTAFSRDSLTTWVVSTPPNHRVVWGVGVGCHCCWWWW